MCLRGFPGANTVRWLASTDPGGAFLRVLHDVHGRLPPRPPVASLRLRPALPQCSWLSAPRSKRQSAGRAGLLAASAATVTGVAYLHSSETLRLRRLWMADDACAVLPATVMIPSPHRLRCCLLLARLQAQTRLGGEPLTLGHRGRHSYGNEQLPWRRSGI